jgi:hypothetical protein
MAILTIDHFRRAVADIVAHGDNDVLPFDVDTRFIAERGEELANIAFNLAATLEKKTKEDCKGTLEAITIFSERLLAPAGSSGFRITTKIHPFWNIYLNGVGVALAEKYEAVRSDRVHSYRFVSEGAALFDKAASWRAFREATISDCDQKSASEMVVQTDVSSFYEHVYHHRLENFVRDILPEGANHAVQIDVLLRKLARGRSFGLPVGGQFSRILAEILMGSIDRTLEASGVRWRRYVDDFVLVGATQRDAYRSLGVLAHALGDLGLSLNRSKTTFLSSRHYREYVQTQLTAPDSATQRLKEIDLHFDPYSDTADDEYDALRETVNQLDMAKLIAVELDKGQPDSFVVTQVSRALRLMEPANALGICATLLEQRNLHAFRANWSTIMRGIAFIRSEEGFKEIHEQLDKHLDAVPGHSPHLAYVDTNALHFLRTLRFKKSGARATYVLSLYSSKSPITVRRACIDCWRHWRDRDRFLSLRNEWEGLSEEEQRMVWVAAVVFGDDGLMFQKQASKAASNTWGTGIGGRAGSEFAKLYISWVANVP